MELEGRHSSKTSQAQRCIASIFCQRVGHACIPDAVAARGSHGKLDIAWFSRDIHVATILAYRNCLRPLFSPGSRFRLRSSVEQLQPRCSTRSRLARHHLHLYPSRNRVRRRQEHTMFRAALRTRLATVPRAPLVVPRAAAQVRFLATPVEPTTDIEVPAVTPRGLASEGVEDLLGPRFAEEESTAIIKRYRGKGFPMIPVSPRRAALETLRKQGSGKLTPSRSATAFTFSTRTCSTASRCVRSHSPSARREDVTRLVRSSTAVLEEDTSSVSVSSTSTASSTACTTSCASSTTRDAADTLR